MPAGAASQSPVRNTSGWTSDFPFAVLGESGFANPFFYHQFADDFDNAIGATGLYTVSGGGTAAHTAGDGGLITLTTLATASALESIQLPAASFTLPATGAAPPGTSNSVKKMFYLARVTIGHSTDSLILGLCNTTATPFTAGVQSVTDGLFLYKPPTSSTLQLINVGSAGNSPSGSGFTNTFTLTGQTITAGQSIDMGFTIDRFQNVRVWVGTQLVGFVPQSGTGAVNAAGVPIIPVLGPVFANYNFLPMGVNPFSASFTNPILFTLANLNITMAISNGTTAAVTTLISDFHLCQKER